MELNQAITPADERARCAALRETVLRYGHLIGWTRRAAIAFAEGVSRRPWKRCSSDQLAEVIGELRDVHQAFRARRLVARVLFEGAPRAVGGIRDDRE